MAMKKVTFIIAFLATLTSFAQEPVSKYNNGVDIKPCIAPFTFDFNLNDLYWSISGGIEDVGYQWGARVNFEFRPFYKKVQVRESGTLTRQYREKRFFFSIDLDKRFGHFELWGAHAQVFAGVKSGILTGNYRGTRDDLDASFAFAPMGGLSFNFDDNVFIKLGLIHFRDKLVNVPDGRITAGVYFVL